MAIDAILDLPEICVGDVDCSDSFSMPREENNMKGNTDCLLCANAIEVHANTIETLHSKFITSRTNGKIAASLAALDAHNELLNILKSHKQDHTGR